MAGIGDSWGTREELLHPRDSHGRFRTKWKMSDAVREAVLKITENFRPRTFPTDAQATQYVQNLAHRKPGRFQGGRGYARLQVDFDNANNDLIDGTPDEPSTQKFIKMMDDSMIEAPEPFISSMVVTPEAFGLTPQFLSSIEDMTGDVIANRGYSPVNLGTAVGGGQGMVTMRLAVPAGTKIAVPGRDPNDRAVYIDRDQEFTITKVKPDGRGGYFVSAVATPRTAGENPVSAGGRAGAGDSGDREADIKGLEDTRMKRDMGEQGASQLPGGQAAGGQPEDAQGRVIPGSTPGAIPATDPATERARRRAAIIGRPAQPQEQGGQPQAPAPEPATGDAVPTPTPEAAPNVPQPAPEGTPSGVEAPEGATSTVTGQPATSFREAVDSAGLESPTKANRKDFNDAISAITTGKRAPSDIVRDLDSDVAELKRKEGQEGVDQEANDRDLVQMEKLADLAREHFKLGEPKYQNTAARAGIGEGTRDFEGPKVRARERKEIGEASGIRKTAAPKISSGVGPKDVSIGPDDTKGAKKPSTAIPRKKTKGPAPTPTFEKDLEDDRLNAEQREAWSGEVGPEPKEMKGSTGDILLDEIADLLRNGRVTRPKAVERLRDQARDDDTPDANYLRKVADAIEADESKPNKRVPLKPKKPPANVDEAEASLAGRTDRNILTGLNQLDVGAMRAVADKWGVETRGEDKKLKLKAALAKELAAHWKATPSVQRKAATPDGEEVAVDDLDGLLLPQLKERAKAEGVKLNSKMRKAEILAELKQRRDNPEAPAEAEVPDLAPEDQRVYDKLRKQGVGREEAIDVATGPPAAAKKAVAKKAKKPTEQELVDFLDNLPPPPTEAEAAENRRNLPALTEDDLREMLQANSLRQLREMAGPDGRDLGLPAKASKQQLIDALAPLDAADSTRAREARMAVPSAPSTPLEALAEAPEAPEFIKKAAKKAAAKAAVAKPSSKDVGARLQEIGETGSPQDGIDYLDGLKLSAKDLKQLSEDLGVETTSKDTKAQLRDRILFARVSGPQNQRAIGRTMKDYFDELKGITGESSTPQVGTPVADIPDVPGTDDLPEAARRAGLDAPEVARMRARAREVLAEMQRVGDNDTDPFADLESHLPDTPSGKMTAKLVRDIRDDVEKTAGPPGVSLEDRVAIRIMSRLTPELRAEALAALDPKQRKAFDEAARRVAADAARVQSGGPSLDKILAQSGHKAPKAGTAERVDYETVKKLLDDNKVLEAKKHLQSVVDASNRNLTSYRESISQPNISEQSRNFLSKQITQELARQGWAQESLATLSTDLPELKPRKATSKAVREVKMELSPEDKASFDALTPDGLRETARRAGIDVPEGARDIKTMYQEILREMARRQLAGEPVTFERPDVPDVKPEPTVPKVSTNIKGDTVEGFKYREAVRRLETGDITPTEAAAEMKAASRGFTARSMAIRPGDGTLSPEARAAERDRNLDVARQYEGAAAELGARKRVPKPVVVEEVLQDAAAKLTVGSVADQIRQAPSVTEAERLLDLGRGRQAYVDLAAELKVHHGKSDSIAKIKKAILTHAVQGRLNTDAILRGGNRNYTPFPTVEETLARAAKTTAPSAMTPQGRELADAREKAREAQEAFQRAERQAGFGDDDAADDLAETLRTERDEAEDQLEAAQARVAKKAAPAKAAPAKAAPPAKATTAVARKDVPSVRGHLTVPDRGDQADEPLFIPNGGADQGQVHMDSLLGQLWQDLAMDNREPNSFVNKVGELAVGVGTPEGGNARQVEVPDALRQLRDLADAASDPAVGDRIREALSGIEKDAPSVKVNLPGDAPEALRRGLERLAEIPLARKKNTRTNFGQNIGEQSLIEPKLDILRRLEAGEDMSVYDITGVLGERGYHEANDGAYRIWQIVDRLKTDKSIKDWLTAKLRANRAAAAAPAAPSPAKAAKKAAPSVEARVETRMDVAKATKAAKKAAPAATSTDYFTEAELQGMGPARLKDIEDDLGITRPSLDRAERVAHILANQGPPPKADGGGRSYAARQAEVAKLADSKPASSPRRLGGGTSITSLLTYDDGSMLIHKDQRRNFDDPKELTDADTVASRVLDAITGGNAAAVHRVDDNELYMEHIDGTLGQDALTRLEGGLSRADLAKLQESPAGRLMGLADALMLNSDRTPSNWILRPNGTVTGIDHGFAFAFNSSKADLWPATASVNPWSKFLTNASGIPRTWIDNPFTPADMEKIHARLVALEPEFQRLGRQAWFNGMMKRFRAIQDHAKGTEDLL